MVKAIGMPAIGDGDRIEKSGENGFFVMFVCHETATDVAFL
jgi:hypothetical protein